MLASIVSETILHCTEGSSDKLYRVQIEEDSAGSYSVRAANCRRGNAWVDQGYKVQGVPLPTAEKKAASIVKSKVGGGYHVIEERGAGAVTPVPVKVPSPVASSPAMRVQLLNQITEAELDRYLDDPNWGMEQKHDGVRRPTRKEMDSITGYNKKGAPVPLDGEVLKGLGTIAGSGDLDGELVGDRLYLFDLLEADGLDLRSKPYRFRRAQLDTLLMGMDSGHVEVVPFVTDPKQKRDDLAWLRRMGAEGVVFKRMDAPFTPGKPNSGGDQVKFKFYESASVVVLGVNSKRSVTMGVLAPPATHPKAAVLPPKFRPDTAISAQEPINVGSVTIPPNHEVPTPGTVIEVRYLYAYPTGSIYQPTYLGPRTDVDVEECLATQLKFRAANEDDDEA